MVNVAKTASNGTAPGQRVHFWCPACDDVHGITVDAPESWTWNGDLERPTFNPSVKVTGVQWPKDSAFYKRHCPSIKPGQPTTCHSFVRDGRIEFLGDCTHQLAGQTVDLPPWPHS